jgi:hypothetical protein
MARQRTKTAPESTAPSPEVAHASLLEGQGPAETAIAALAYQLWHGRGCPEGSPETDWFQAKRELRGQPDKPKSLSTKRPLLIRQVSA